MTVTQAAPGHSRPRTESYEQLVERLSVQSVKKHYDAFADIDWDSPDNAIDPEDPRWEVSDYETLGATAWYKAQPQATRARMGLNLTANSMKTGIVFENILQRGLLEFAMTLPNRSPEFRYAYHEIIEEGQHTLMFQEFINRSGFDPDRLPWHIDIANRFVVRLGRVFPELFLMFVLGGEEPIDFVQKRTLKQHPNMHPLLRRICQIHVTEEARHLCFAHKYLERNVPKLGFFARLRLSIVVPIIFSQMAKLMLEPSPAIVKRYNIPASVIKEAYSDNELHKLRVRQSLESVQDLCKKLGVLKPRDGWWWRLLGLGRPFALPAATQA